jgi:hypothetical protein
MCNECKELKKQLKYYKRVVEKCSKFFGTILADVLENSPKVPSCTEQIRSHNKDAFCNKKEIKDLAFPKKGKKLFSKKAIQELAERVAARINRER